MPGWIKWLIPSVVMMLVINQRRNRHNALDSSDWLEEYDYVVVGAGAAGCIVASRLAEDRKVTVLLVEAGGPQTVRSDIPALQYLLLGTEQDWNYPTEPQANAYQAYVGNRKSFPRGKGFGGSSAINSMNYYRDNEEYFRFWTDITGVDNWHFKDVLPFFLKSENNLDEKIVSDNPQHHRTGGLLTVTTGKADPILDRFMIAANMSGSRPTYTDGRQPFGSTLMQRTIKDGTRQSTSVAFLESRRQPNRHSIGHSFVTRVLFDKNKRAVGIEFIRNGKYHRVRARKEVIVSAGAIGSPKLLMNSGIGPKRHLIGLNIAVISDLPVGNRLLTPFQTEIRFDIKYQYLVEKPIENEANLQEYYLNKSGPLVYKISGVICFKEIPHPDYPCLSNGCILPRTEYLSTDLNKLVDNFKLKDQWKEYYRPYLNRTNFLLIAMVRRPRTAGTIRLRSANPLDSPLIDWCTFCDDRDLTDLINTMKLALKIYTSDYMSKFIQHYQKPVPGCSPCADDYFCDSYLRCVATSVTSYAVPVGGCQLGLKGDTNAVVDSRLRVFGVTALRVIDSSIIPVASEQNYAHSIMIGEYGSHMIKSDHGHI